MDYNLIWKPEAEEEFDKLDHALQKHAFTQLKKLKKSPQLGLPLGKKAGLDLTGFQKLYFSQKKYRIVYQLDEKNKKVIIWSIGKREDMKVYVEAVKRLRSLPSG
ncbi:MAG: type II toxin-antitoxin system RelE/ParE family toxin [Candidatus Omnitrophica bacterium]|nr:type II toxin-antitoxin system RelE/ParE family toxin [Candidatus Omnitrophota bacterium]MBU0878178.1 type II toxin-antitoxin system RelE/ParE family toxin [Candidatus Omnitrophota bacterium]MBU0896557.1 type II toxin-antitoxin system RelE/ParE family toxin [Candidatus Omnitrophota bacterium]MBU1133327.1 type II toxin-antitoxin system RelE/ParE family toxin [Candidatus Omnitrophota bacterium]MBU1367660.1 type II toxin-antitoxin system RelE/ParE family toxin [Candidatus Omnitrophota bacterium